MPAHPVHQQVGFGAGGRPARDLIRPPASRPYPSAPPPAKASRNCVACWPEASSAFTGNSGVGKSESQRPGAELRPGHRRDQRSLGRGRHTTRHVELFRLPTGRRSWTPRASPPLRRRSWSRDEAAPAGAPSWSSGPIWASAASSAAAHTKEKGCAVLAGRAGTGRSRRAGTGAMCGCTSWRK